MTLLALVAGAIPAAIGVSRQFGDSNIWPGDTIGLSVLPGSRHARGKLQVSWGSAIDGRISQIFTAAVTP